MFCPRILGFVAKVLGPSDSECDLHYGFPWFSGLRFGGLHHWLSQGAGMLTGDPGLLGLHNPVSQPLTINIVLHTNIYLTGSISSGET